MSRTLCQSCQRPEKSCICQFTTEVANDIHVVVLQHPSEVSQVKGTIALLAKSLSSCQVLIGEDFSEDTQLLKIVEQYKTLLLYPGENAKTLDETLIASWKVHIDIQGSEQVSSLVINDDKKIKPLCLVILDGTWKKAYRMFRVSNNLQQLAQVSLPEYLANAGQYLIRKVAKKNALSSLEATCYALALLDAGPDFNQVSAQQAGKYQPLLNKFQAFNQFHLSFRPDALKSKV